MKLLSQESYEIFLNLANDSTILSKKDIWKVFEAFVRVRGNMWDKKKRLDAFHEMAACSPEKLNGCSNLDYILICAVAAHNVGLVMEALRLGANSTVLNDQAWKSSVLLGSIEMFIMIAESRESLNSFENRVIRTIVLNNQLELLKFLDSRGFYISLDDGVLYDALLFKRTEIVKFLLRRIEATCHSKFEYLGKIMDENWSMRSYVKKMSIWYRKSIRDSRKNGISFTFC